MDASHKSLIIGAFLNFLYIVLSSYATILLRVALIPAQTSLALRLFGFFITTLPICLVAIRNW